MDAINEGVTARSSKIGIFCVLFSVLSHPAVLRVCLHDVSVVQPESAVGTGKSTAPTRVTHDLLHKPSRKHCVNNFDRKYCDVKT